MPLQLNESQSESNGWAYSLQHNSIGLETNPRTEPMAKIFFSLQQNT